MKNIATNEKIDRKTYIDAVKILAIFLVLFNHTGTKGYVLFLISKNSSYYWLYVVSSILTKINIPLFLMASGALLLKKEESIKTILRKRFFKYLIILIICSFISYLYTCFRLKYLNFSFGYFIKTLYEYGLNTSYWYLYMYLAYILMLPFLRKLAKAMTNKEYMWMIITYAIMEILSIVEFLIWKGTVTHNISFSFFMHIDYIFYPLIGFFIEERLSKENFNRKNFLIMILLSVVVVIICCLLTNYRCKILNQWNEENSQKFLNVLIFIPTITIFYGIKWLSIKHSLNTNNIKAITTISGSVLGIYLFEQIWRQETEKIYYLFLPYVGSWFASVIWILLACVLGGIATLLFKKFINNFKIDKESEVQMKEKQKTINTS